jgi:hypothetical protein
MPLSTERYWISSSRQGMAGVMWGLMLAVKSDFSAAPPIPQLWVPLPLVILWLFLFLSALALLQRAFSSFRPVSCCCRVLPLAWAASCRPKGVSAETRAVSSRNLSTGPRGAVAEARGCAQRSDRGARARLVTLPRPQFGWSAAPVASWSAAGASPR